MKLGSNIWSYFTVPVRSLVVTSSVNFSGEEFNPLTDPGNRKSTCCKSLVTGLPGLNGSLAPLP